MVAAVSGDERLDDGEVVAGRDRQLRLAEDRLRVDRGPQPLDGIAHRRLREVAVDDDHHAVGRPHSELTLEGRNPSFAV